jgi:hypothetical protein
MISGMVHSVMPSKNSGDRFDLEMANHETASEVLIRESEMARKFRERGGGFADDVADPVTGDFSRTN